MRKTAQSEFSKKAAALKTKNAARTKVASLRAMLADHGTPAAQPPLHCSPHDNSHVHSARGPPTDQPLVGDILEGAAAIAQFLYGRSGPKERRRIYWLVESNALPVFYLGQIICARRSTLMREFTQREARLAELAAQS
jgi:hypothetical protein